MTRSKRMSEKKFKAIALVTIIFFWGLIAGTLSYLTASFMEDKYGDIGNIHDDHVSRVESHTCSDIKLSIPQNFSKNRFEACYLAQENKVKLRIKNVGKASIFSVMVNIIGEDGMAMLDEEILLTSLESTTLFLEYDFEENGMVEFVEIVPHLNQETLKRCESSKLIMHEVLSC